MLGQNEGYECLGRLMPCLTQVCMPWSFQAGRPLTPEEAFVVQGAPMFDFLEAVSAAPRPFDCKEFTPRELFSLAGNGQSLIVMGCALAWCLSCTSPREEHQQLARGPQLDPAQPEEGQESDTQSIGCCE